MSTTRFIIVFIVSFVFVRVAEAHAFLDHADPKVGSTLRDPPSEVTVWMTENLEAAFSPIAGTRLSDRNFASFGLHSP